MNINIKLKDLIEAGMHLGHKTNKWNPSMNKYIYGSQDNIHIIDLVQTLEMIDSALQAIHKCISSGG